LAEASYTGPYGRGVARHQTHVPSLQHSYDGPRWSDPYHCEWGAVVGDRIRRLRRDRGWSLAQMALRVYKPDGGHYSAGYFSRLERGWASAPLYVYLVIAEVLEVKPGVLLGEDEAVKEIGAEQRVLLDFLEAAGIGPGEALARLARPKI
jgi:transcriptional regulator with XRE-family HTH domain